MAEYAAPVDPQEGLQVFGDFLGLRNNVGESMLTTEDLVVATNIDIADSLDISRRMGYAAISDAIDRDLWASGPMCLGVGGDALKRVNTDWTISTLRSGLAAGRPLSYAEIGNRVFWTNGNDMGVVQDGANRTWGIVPPAVSVATAMGGTLRSGIYQYAVTALRSDGQESGARRAGTIELTAAGGIALSGIEVSADPTVTAKSVYCTSVGGETLYRSGIIPNSQTTFLIDTIRVGASPLMTQFLSPPLPGNFIAELRGHLLVAWGNLLCASEPYAPELFDLRKTIPFRDRITMLAPIDDGKFYRQHGLYVGTENQLIWLEGDSPEKFEFRVLANYGIIPGTLTYGDGDSLGAGESKEKIAYFASKNGLCAGKMGGDFTNLTASRFAYPIQERGASIVRKHRGMVQLLVSMSGAEINGNVAA
jgi:hypothetical protein